MNATNLAKTAYSAPGQPIRTARGAEYELLARVTRKLKQCGLSDQRQFAALAAAIYENRRLWSILAADLALPDNLLSERLRARLLYLAKFTDHHSRRVLAGESDVAVLVDINTAVMRGLRQTGGGA